MMKIYTKIQFKKKTDIAILRAKMCRLVSSKTFSNKEVAETFFQTFLFLSWWGNPDLFHIPPKTKRLLCG